MRFHETTLLKILSSETKLKIVKFLLTHNATMSEREIASVLKVSHMSINRTMRELATLNFGSFVTVGGSHLWKVNHKSYAFKALSFLTENASGIKDPLNDLKTVIKETIPKALAQKVVLFGSVSKGLEKSDSDIDIFILVMDAGDKKKIEPSIEKLSHICFETYGNRLAPYILTEQEMAQKKDLAILSEINNGTPIL